MSIVLRRVLRAGLIWSIPLIALSLLLEPLQRLIGSGPLQIVIAILIVIALVSFVRAALSLSRDMLTGRYDVQRQRELEDEVLSREWGS